MSKLLSDLQVNVRTYLDESQQVDFTNTEVLYAINYAYHTVVSKVVEVYQEFYLTTTPKSYSTVANQQEYTLDTTLLKIERVEINMNPSDANSQAQRAAAIRLDEIQTAKNSSLLNGSSLSQTGYYVIGSQASQKIGFVPVPTETGTNNISVWGIEAPSDLSSSSDPVLIPYPDMFAQIIAKLAAGSLLKKGQQAVQAGDDLIIEANGDILNMQTFLVERQSDGPNMIEESAWDDVELGSYIF